MLTPERPRDRVGIALLIGLAVAALVPTFFMAAMPDLRTGAGTVWLVGAGLLMGGSAYCQRRARAYLVDEPARFGFLRQWRLMNPARYAEPGRRFVRAQVVLTATLPIWWLVGGPIAFGWSN